MIKTKVKETEVEVTESLVCDNCGKDIPLVFPEDVDGLTEQGKDALQIKFGGGYGMYVDPLVQFKLKALWCKECADKLIEAFPSIGKMLNFGM